MKRHVRLDISVAVVLSFFAMTTAHAQTIKPPPTESPKKERTGKTIVVNPTVEQCRHGWTSDLKWTKEQFDAYCARVRSSK
jgi:hypothetical protein